MATSRRPSARASQTLTSYELAVLRAKAAVCDAYRNWLDTPTHTARKPLTIALLELAALEGHNRA